MTHNRILSGSFFMAPLFRSPAKRRDLEALYAFCGEAVNALDTAMSAQDAHGRLEALRVKLAAAYHRAPGSAPDSSDSLTQLIHRHALRQEYFGALLDGLEMDGSPMVRPPLSTLSFYCYRVGSCPLLLSLPVLGAEGPHAESFAIALGMALQLTGILLSVQEDALRGRIYLPREWLEEEGIGDITPESINFHYKAVTLVCISLAERAEQYYKEAEELSRQLNQRRLYPALFMRDRQHHLLRMLIKRRAFLRQDELRIGRWRKTATALKAARYFLAIARP